MKRLSGSWIVIIIMLLLDIYVFQALKFIMINASPKWRSIAFISYWLVSGLSFITVMLLPYIFSDAAPRILRSYVFSTVIGIFIAKLLGAVFFLLDDSRRVLVWLWRLVLPASKQITQGEYNITRSAFLSWAGFMVGGSVFTSLLYGFRNKYRYQVEKVNLKFNHLPASFKGLKIVQVSDIHSGSFTDREAVMQGVKKILDQKPDLILFTGDLVNDMAKEMNDWMDVFSQLKAPMGVYSILGNHDYGDYMHWETAEAKKQNLDRLKQIHAELGWRLLLNEHVVLERNGEQIALIGIENWGKGTFSKYGKMEVAYSGTEKYPFKILMSHDPSHWDAEVIKRYKDVDLTLSGHTHGMQFGVEVPGFKWSPVQYMYKRWAGLYEDGQQKLYVNRGFGFIGYPGRVGILPEITVLQLA
jgi:predicted MPP superfamily phosphohydrolase